MSFAEEYNKLIEIGESESAGDYTRAELKKMHGKLRQYVRMVTVTNMKATTEIDLKFANFAKECDAIEFESDGTAMFRLGNEDWRVIVGQDVSLEGVPYLAITPFFERRQDVIQSYSVDHLVVRIKISVKNADEEKWITKDNVFEASSLQPIGWNEMAPLDDILAPGSGFLDEEGALNYRISMAVSYIIDENQIRRDNVFDEFPNSLKFVVGQSKTVYYAEIESLKKHCPRLRAFIDKGNRLITAPKCNESAFELFLQLIQGVDEVLTKETANAILEVANSFNAKRIVARCKPLLEEKETKA